MLKDKQFWSAILLAPLVFLFLFVFVVGLLSSIQGSYDELTFLPLTVPILLSVNYMVLIPLVILLALCLKYTHRLTTWWFISGLVVGGGIISAIGAEVYGGGNRIVEAGFLMGVYNFGVGAIIGIIEGVVFWKVWGITKR